MRSSNMGMFSDVPKIQIPRTLFDRSHSVKTTFDADFIVPILVDPIYPGDTVNLDISVLLRMETPIFPIMDNLYCDIFWFFTPNRLLWSKWDRFLGEQEDPGDSIDLTLPVMTLDTDCSARHSCLLDYLGIPMIDYNTSNYTCQAMPIRSYFLIWNEFFRDQNLQDTVNHYGWSGSSWDIPDGPDSDSYVIDNTGVNGLLKRGKRHDYFTSCLPWLQKDPDSGAVELPLGTSANITTDGADNAVMKIYSTDKGDVARLTTAGAADDPLTVEATSGDPASYLYADLSSATAATVNEVRQAFQVQRLLERDARAGTRQHEIIYSHFGVVPPHMSWRPEYLGGGSFPINVTPVAGTATGVNHNTGDLSGVVTGYSQGNGFVKSFREYGWLMGLINVRIDQSYSEGFERFWQDSTRYDIYWPSLSHIGEQAVLNREIYIDDATITATTDDDVFGYQERYAHLKYHRNMITGNFRSNSANTLEVRHLQEEFAAEPDLDAAFIVSNASEGIDRTIVGSEPHQFFMDAWINMKHTRAMPAYSVPGLIDHF